MGGGKGENGLVRSTG